MNCAEKHFCEPKAVSLFCRPVLFFAILIVFLVHDPARTITGYFEGNIRGPSRTVILEIFAWDIIIMTITCITMHGESSTRRATVSFAGIVSQQIFPS